MAAEVVEVEAAVEEAEPLEEVGLLLRPLVVSPPVMAVAGVEEVEAESPAEEVAEEEEVNPQG